MDVEHLKYILQELEFSAALPADVLAQLAGMVDLQSVKAATVLFREGSENRYLYLLRSGRIGLDMNVPGRGPVRILTIGPGEMIGWSALVSQSRMTASATALEESEVIVAPSDELYRLCLANAVFGFHLMHRMALALSKRLVATRLQLLDLFVDRPPQQAIDRREGKP